MNHTLAGIRLAPYLGNLGEALANIAKNKERIASLTHTAAYRIPDVLDKANKLIGEVKNVGMFQKIVDSSEERKEGRMEEPVLSVAKDWKARLPPSFPSSILPAKSVNTFFRKFETCRRILP